MKFSGKSQMWLGKEEKELMEKIENIIKLTYK